MIDDIDIRCPTCGALLARRTREGLEVKKKDLLLIIVGVAIINCASCHRVTTVRSRFAESEETAIV